VRHSAIAAGREAGAFTDPATLIHWRKRADEILTMVKKP
jgi:hypothetical protein